MVEEDDEGKRADLLPSVVLVALSSRPLTVDEVIVTLATVLPDAPEREAVHECLALLEAEGYVEQGAPPARGGGDRLLVLSASGRMRAAVAREWMAAAAEGLSRLLERWEGGEGP